MCLLNGYVSKTPDNPVAPKILDLLRMFEPNKHYKVSKVLKQLRPVVEKLKLIQNIQFIIINILTRKMYVSKFLFLLNQKYRNLSYYFYSKITKIQILKKYLSFIIME